MRISDWSSDVCSSDLPALGLPQHRDGGAVRGRRHRPGPPRGVPVPGGPGAELRGVPRRGGRALLARPNRGPAAGAAGGAEDHLPAARHRHGDRLAADRVASSEEHTADLQPLMRTSYAVFHWKKKTNIKYYNT